MILLQTPWLYQLDLLVYLVLYLPHPVQLSNHWSFSPKHLSTFNYQMLSILKQRSFIKFEILVLKNQNGSHLSITNMEKRYLHNIKLCFIPCLCINFLLSKWGWRVFGFWMRMSHWGNENCKATGFFSELQVATKVKKVEWDQYHGSSKKTL